MIFIGIDCGVKTGFAMWDADEQEWLDVEAYDLAYDIKPIITTDFWAAWQIVGELQYKSDRRICCKVEDPSNIDAVWYKGKGAKGGRKGLRVAQNVGMNKREAQLMIEGLNELDVLVDPITPKQSKLDAKTFKQIAKYQGSTSQHARDAAMLVVGLRPIPDAQWQQLLKQEGS